MLYNTVTELFQQKTNKCFTDKVKLLFIITINVYKT